VIVNVSRTFDPEHYERLRAMAQTPNRQRITKLRTTGRRLLVYTRSRVYYLRRGRLRLWRVL